MGNFQIHQESNVTSPYWVMLIVLDGDRHSFLIREGQTTGTKEFPLSSDTLTKQRPVLACHKNWALSELKLSHVGENEREERAKEDGAKKKSDGTEGVGKEQRGAKKQQQEGLFSSDERNNAITKKKLSSIIATRGACRWRPRYPFLQR